MSRVYLDTNMVIALVEDGAPGAAYVRAWLQANVGSVVSVVVSDLVRIECRVKPLRVGDATLLADYDAYFGDDRIDVVPLSPVVCDRAASIRAFARASLADALHLAAATEAACDLFVSADRRLAGFEGLPVAIVEP